MDDHAPCPVISIGLVVITIICHCIDLRYKIPADYINFSGHSIIQRRQYHVLVLSSFFHGSTSHLCEEITLLLPIAIIIEQNIGAIFLLCIYFGFGIIGSLLTWIADRRYYDKIYPDGGIALADYIWSRGASGNVYGLMAFTAPLYGPSYLFEDVRWSASQYGLLWCLLTNLLFHVFSHRSRFSHRETFLQAYLVTLVLTGCVLCFCPNAITLNTYLVVYFIHMSILRRNPSIFNHDGPSFIASDFKCHLFSALIGSITAFAYAVCMYRYQQITWTNLLPLLLLTISDGYYGQYAVHKRIQRRILESKQNT